MAVGLALLVSADPMTVQQFSHALKEEILPEFVAGKFRSSVELLQANVGEQIHHCNRW